MPTSKLKIGKSELPANIIRENDGSYAIACKNLRVYSVAKTLSEVKKNLADALLLHIGAKVRE